MKKRWKISSVLVSLASLTTKVSEATEKALTTQTSEASKFKLVVLGIGGALIAGLLFLGFKMDRTEDKIVEKQPKKKSKVKEELIEDENQFYDEENEKDIPYVDEDEEYEKDEVMAVVDDQEYEEDDISLFDVSEEDKSSFEDAEEDINFETVDNSTMVFNTMQVKEELGKNSINIFAEEIEDIDDVKDIEEINEPVEDIIEDEYCEEVNIDFSILDDEDEVEKKVKQETSNLDIFNEVNQNEEYSEQVEDLDLKIASLDEIDEAEIFEEELVEEDFLDHIKKYEEENKDIVEFSTATTKEDEKEFKRYTKKKIAEVSDTDFLSEMETIIKEEQKRNKKTKKKK